MKKITIELNEDLEINVEGVENYLESIALLELAKSVLITGIKERCGLLKMTEQ